jgi:hypothetical protein
MGETAGGRSFGAWVVPPAVDANRARPTTEPGLEGQKVLDVVVLEPGRGGTGPVAVPKAEFREQVERLARGLQPHGGSKEAAAKVLEVQQLLRRAEESRAVSDVDSAGRFSAEVEPWADGGRGRVDSVLPEEQWGPVRLEPQAEAALREQYARFCIVRGGGDCLGLLEDGPYLRSDDRATLALALAFGSVLDETYAALGREVSPKAILASIMWTVGLYLGLWLLPEPASGHLC